MKKIFALMLTLCLLCASTAFATVTETGTKVDLDGFSLNLDAGMYYDLYEKGVNQLYAAVYPFYGSGDLSTNYNIVWAGGEFEITVEDVAAEAPSMEANIRSGLEAQGITVDSVDMDEPYDATINGVPCVAVDYVLHISYAGQNLDIYGREIVIGSIGYIFTLSTASEELMDTATQALADALEI